MKENKLEMGMRIFFQNIEARINCYDLFSCNALYVHKSILMSFCHHLLSGTYSHMHQARLMTIVKNYKMGNNLYVFYGLSCWP